MKTVESYGMELILDLCACEKTVFGVEVPFDVQAVQEFCVGLCDAIGMKAETFTEWASEPLDERNPKTYGISAVQFLLTSNITVHWLPLYRGGSLMLNVFSCEKFSVPIVVSFVRGMFRGRVTKQQILERLP